MFQNASGVPSPELKSRREFLEFLGQSVAVASLSGLVPLLSSCTTSGTSTVNTSALPMMPAVPGLPFVPLAPISEDKVSLAEGFQSQILLRWGDTLNKNGEAFGTNCDYLAFFPLNAQGTDGILWVNHESLHPLFVSGHIKGSTKTREQVIKEQKSVGGSLVRIRRDEKSNQWQVVADDAFNRRISGETPIPLISARPIEGSNTAMGTLANCAGGFTPWGTVLTCEENYNDFYGETIIKDGEKVHDESSFGWEKYFPNPPEHYGWVVEIHPLTGAAKKLTGLGRFAHECATVRLAKDGRCVVYTGDDAEDRCLYKFIADRPGSLETGTLYVADMMKKAWIPLSHKTQPLLKKNFKDQTDVLIRCREAAALVGGTPLARPEDIKIEPISGAVFVTLTNSAKHGNYHGSILKLEEKNNDPLALEFHHSTFLAGGPETGFSCPDNLVFDRRGNLWMTSDISGKSANKPPYDIYKNNSLFYIPLNGPLAGQVFRVATAPHDAEFTGPIFSPDGRTLFLSVQHPGEVTNSLDKVTSHWPDGGDALPRSSVIAISGPALDKLMEGPGIPPVFEIPVLKA